MQKNSNLDKLIHKNIMMIQESLIIILNLLYQMDLNF